MKYIGITEVELSTWEKCIIIGMEIVNEFSKNFSGGSIEYDTKHIHPDDLRFFGVTLRYEKLEVFMTIQDRKELNKPFVYMDGIKTQGESRGKGLTTKVLDSLSSLVRKGVFKYLNVKDNNSEFWAKMLERYDFIKPKYVTGYEAG